MELIANPYEQVEIEYEPGPAAVRFHRSPARVKVAWGPVRTGKSTAACWRIYLKAHEVGQQGIGLRALIMRDTYRNLEDTTLKTWLEWFGKCGVLKHRSSVTDFTFYTPNCKEPHEVLFRHGQTESEASSFLSSEYGVIFLEEAAPAFTPSGLVSPGIAEGVFDVALTRLVQRGVLEPELLITCNPPTPQHWVNRRIIAQPPDNLRRMNWWHFFFPAIENEMNLRPGYYDELRKQLAGKDHILRRFVEGEIVAIYPGVPVFSRDFSQSAHVRDKLEPVPGAEVFFGFDVGESITPAAVFMQIDPKGRILVLKEIQGGYSDERLREGIGTREFAQQIKHIHSTMFSGCPAGEVYADPAVNHKQPNDLKTVGDILVSEGFIPIPSKIDITSRVEAIRERLQTNIEGEPSILFSRSGCPLLIEALSGAYRYRTSMDGQRITGGTPVKDIYSNPIDALGYALARLFPVGQFSRAFSLATKPERKTQFSVFNRRSA